MYKEVVSAKDFAKICQLVFWDTLLKRNDYAQTDRHDRVHYQPPLDGCHLIIIQFGNSVTMKTSLSGWWAMLRKNTNAYFTPPTRIRQNCLVLSCPCRRCEQNWRQDKTVLSRLDPVSNLQQFSLKYIEDNWRLGNWKLGQTVFSCRQFCSHRRHGQDKTVLSSLCRRRKRPIKVGLRTCYVF